MTRRQQDISWTDSLPVEMTSGRKAKGKSKRRTVHADAEKRFVSDMDEAEWQAYYYGPPGGAHGPVRRKPYAATAAQLGLKPGDWKDPKYRRAYNELIILRPGTAEPEKKKKDPDGIFLVMPGKPDESHHLRFMVSLKMYEGKELRKIEAFDAKKGYGKYWMTADMKEVLEKSGFVAVWDDSQGKDNAKRHYKISPGNNTVSQLEAILAHNDGKALEIVLAYNQHYDFGLILCTPKAAAELAKRGFILEEFDPSMYGHLGGHI